MSGKFVLSIVLILATGSAYAQSRPDWIRVKPTAENNTYFYDIGEATGTTEAEALNRARAVVVSKTISRLGMPVETEKVRSALINGTPIEAINSQYNIPIFETCHWSESAGVVRGVVSYRAWVLCQVAVSGNVPPRFDLSFNRCSSDHEFSTGWAILSSALLPGLGQMGKRHYGEGVVTLISEIALVGGAMITYFIGKSDLDKMTSGLLSYNDYVLTEKRYNSLRTANRILWGSAVALYVFNLYRAATLHPNYKQVVFVEPSVIITPNEFLPAVELTFRF